MALPLDSVTRFLAARLAPELPEMAAALESADTLKLLKEHVLGLAVVVEQVGHLVDMAVADEAAEEAKDKKRVAAADESDDDRHAKIGKVECGSFQDNVWISAAGIACFYSDFLAVSAPSLLVFCNLFLGPVDRLRGKLKTYVIHMPAVTAKLSICSG
ncbi:hypothetical protein HU200_005894 [Digitaria exilis]|uniref:Uncharacterized protein n=1 Tax=Digitaria exilis TaxID=1010633 RepID=A0A835FR62_9POAL|nr:hypothetical protein HU200_005894 [Digitaria exilis]